MKKNSQPMGQACDSLCSVPNKMHVKIVSIEAGCRAKTRLNHLGIIPGTEISIQSAAPFNGPIQIKFRDTTICIGKGLAQKIKVEKCCNEKGGSIN